MKYKDRNDFAEEVINEIPFVKSLNIKVEVTETHISYTAIDGTYFNGGNELSDWLMTRLGGIIDGLRYAYEKLGES